MTVAGICDLPGSPKINYSVNGPVTASRVVLCPWESWRDYAAQLAPASIVVGTVNLIKPAEQLGYLPSLRVSGFEIEPYYGQQDRILTDFDTNLVTGVDDLPVYEQAKFTISYAIPTSPQSLDDAEGIDPVPFLDHRITSGGQLLDLSAETQWKWSLGGATLDMDAQKLPKIISTTQHDVIWPRVPQPHWPNLEKFKGHVNSEAFTLRGYEYQAESLMYLNYDMQETVMTDGNRAYNLALHFEGKLVKNETEYIIGLGTVDEYGGHNHYWDKTQAIWNKIVSVDSAERSPSPKADFNDLFKALP